MKRGLEQFDKWIQEAHFKSAPSLDVTARVANTIQNNSELVSIDRPYFSIAAVSTLAATFAMCVAWQTWVWLEDPLVQLFTPLELVMR